MGVDNRSAGFDARHALADDLLCQDWNAGLESTSRGPVQRDFNAGLFSHDSSTDSLSTVSVFHSFTASPEGRISGQKTALATVDSSREFESQTGLHESVLS
jgi:hypothetical protein